MGDNHNRRIVPPPLTEFVARPNKYKTANNLEFFYDYNSHRILVPELGFSVNFAHGGERGSEQYLYIKMNELSIQFSGPEGEALPATVYQNPHTPSVWRFGAIGDPLYRVTLSNEYTRRQLPGPLDRCTPIATDKKFQTLDQQDIVLKLVAEVLKKYNGIWTGAARGDEQVSRVKFTPDLLGKIKRGEYIAG